MRNLLVVMACVLAVGSLVGCGGGGGGTAVTNAVAITVSNGVTSSQPNPTVSYRSAAQLPSAPVGQAFVSGAVCSPVGTTFSQPVALTFTLTTPLENGATVTLFQSDAQGNWTNVTDAVVHVSPDRLTLSVDISGFTGTGFAIFKS